MVDSSSEVCDGAQEQVRRSLHSTLFLGTYTERRYVENIRAYRDVVEIGPSEDQFRHRLRQALRKLDGIGSTAVGIVTSPNFSLLVRLRSPTPLGPHWFQVRGLDHDRATGEVALRLKHVREVQPIELQTSSSDIQEEKTLWTEWVTAAEGLRTIARPTTLAQGIKFAALLLLAAGSGLITGLKIASNLSLTLMRESSKMIHAATPLLLGVSGMVARLLTAVLVFFAMVWKDLFYLMRRKLDPEGTPPVPPPTISSPYHLPALPPSAVHRFPRLQGGPGYQSFVSPTPPPVFAPHRRGNVQITELQ